MASYSFNVTEVLDFLTSLITLQVMSNQEAVDLIKKIKDAQSAAKLLIDEAISRKSKDDISCIVVKLR